MKVFEINDGQTVVFEPMWVEFSTGEPGVVSGIRAVATGVVREGGDGEKRRLFVNATVPGHEEVNRLWISEIPDDFVIDSLFASVNAPQANELDEEEE